MLIYRPHRGSLEEALKCRREFISYADMKNYIVEEQRSIYGGFAPFSQEHIVVESEIFNDERIGWSDTRRVCITRFGDTEFDVPQCIGWCAEDYPEFPIDSFA